MKNKEITKVLDKSFEDLLEILPLEFRENFKASAFVAGGSIWSLHNDIPVNDYDFFLEDKELASNILDYFKKYMTEEYEHFSKGLYKGHSVMITKNAISFDGKYQIIVKWIGTVKEVINEFDFKHNMFGYKYKKDIECFSEWDFLDDRSLRFNENRARDLCGTIMRLPKFVNKGFDISKSEVSKILKKLNEKGFDEREVEILDSIEGY